MLALITYPLSLAYLIIQLGVRVLALPMLMCLFAVKAVINFHLDLFWRLLMWFMGCLSIPLRMMTAFQREQTLELQLLDMRHQLENLIWENKQLEDRLQNALKDQKVLETVLEDVEEEHEQTLERVDLLEAELQDMKAENQRLVEVRGKTVSDYKIGNAKDINVHDKIPVVPWKSSNTGGAVIWEDILMRGSPWNRIIKGSLEHEDALQVSGTFLSPAEIMEEKTMDEVVEREKVVALYRSLFSSLLSLLVGMIIWEAEDTCTPLLIALFFVVGMSLSSVVQFFSSVKNKPASDAVALLSINWFVLGTLTSPTLPSVARALTPYAIRIVARFSSWLGFPAVVV